MSVSLQFNAKPGDVFRYQGRYTSRTGTNTNRTEERVVAVEGGGIQIVDPNDPEQMVTVYDRRGYPVDILQNGASIKADMPEDVFDISNRLIFPDGPVNPGDRWAADDGVVHVDYQLVGTGRLKEHNAAEIHATTQGYNGPIKYWVELATGKLLRQEYQVGTTSTVIERL